MEHRSTPATPLPQQKGTTTPQLSCELCRKRKVKCDKLNPCTNCASAGTACIPIYRMRLPRGRHVNHPRRVSQSTVQVNENFQGRIHRLEALIHCMGSTNTESASSREQSVHLSNTSTFPSAPTCSPTLSSSTMVSKSLVLQRPDHFWADLVKEIHGLRDVIESSLGEAEEDTMPSSDSAKIEPPDDGVRLSRGSFVGGGAGFSCLLFGHQQDDRKSVLHHVSCQQGRSGGRISRRL